MRRREVAQFLGVGLRSVVNYLVRYRAGEFPEAPKNGVFRRGGEVHVSRRLASFLLSYVVRRRDMAILGVKRARLIRGRGVKLGGRK